MSNSNCTLVWLRRDLRLADQPALYHAARRGPVIPIYIHAPDEEAPWQPGAASRWWLHHSLAALSKQLHALGSQLIIRTGSTQTVLHTLLQETGADAVYWNRLYEPALIQRDTSIKQWLSDLGLQAKSFNAALLHEPWQIQTQQNQPYRVFTPFWRACRQQQQAGYGQPGLLAVPKPLFAPPHWPKSSPLDSLQLLPTINWDTGLLSRWQVGENAALNKLSQFLDGHLQGYEQQRDLPAMAGTSSLSPHLHFGEIGPRQILWATQQHGASQPDSPDQQRFLAEIGWREFAHHLLYHYPHTTEAPLNEKFNGFPWRNDPSSHTDLRRWQQGETGINLVDAGMKELWHSGWMHNRVRMVAASLLTKNMRLPWQHGARWFWDTLVDADLASNTLGWQWVAGCGADAAPYFRVFNPDTQAKKFDPDAHYRQRWLGADWADRTPTVDLKSSRTEALAAWKSL